MAIDFPDSPTNGQEFTVGTIKYAYNSTKGIWYVSASGAKVQVQETQPSGPAEGDMWFKASTNIFHIYDGSAWELVAFAQPPSITSVSPASFNGDSGTEFTINGANYDAQTVVSFINASGTVSQAASTTFVNFGQLKATTTSNYTVSDGPLDIRIATGAGKTGTFNDQIQTGATPVWSTASGVLQTNATGSGSDADSYHKGADLNEQLTATDADGSAITYTLASGTLPPGGSLSSAGLISGTITAASISADTTFTFTVQAADTVGNSVTRQFQIKVINEENYLYTLQTADYGSNSQSWVYFSVNGTGSNRVILWGAGGAASSSGSQAGGSGATVEVTLNAGQKYNFRAWAGNGGTSTSNQNTDGSGLGMHGGGGGATSGVVGGAGGSGTAMQITQDGTNWYTFAIAGSGGGGSYHSASVGRGGAGGAWFQHSNTDDLAGGYGTTNWGNYRSGFNGTHRPGAGTGTAGNNAGGAGGSSSGNSAYSGGGGGGGYGGGGGGAPGGGTGGVPQEGGRHDNITGGGNTTSWGGTGGGGAHYNSCGGGGGGGGSYWTSSSYGYNESAILTAVGGAHVVTANHGNAHVSNTTTVNGAQPSSFSSTGISSTTGNGSGNGSGAAGQDGGWVYDHSI